MEQCKQTCSKIFREDMLPECQSKCFAQGSTCAKYSVCPPVGPFQFEYLCDDGNPPMTNGCCPKLVNGEQKMGCPSLCDSHSYDVPQYSMAGATFYHGWECQCYGCPDGMTEAKGKLREALTSDTWQNGVATLALISKEVGILGANRRMQELMQERNQLILQKFEALPALPDDAFQQEVNQIIARYDGLIRAEAQRFKDAGEVPEDTSGNNVVPLDTDDPQEKEAGNDGIILIAAISASAAVVIALSVLLLYYMMNVRGRSAAGSRGRGFGAESTGTDSTVVMGRPVDNPDVNAVAGAPVGGSGPALKGNGGSKDNEPPTEKV